MRDVVSAMAYATWCRLFGRPHWLQALRQQEMHGRSAEYEVIPASRYLEVALARQAARARLADLQPIRE